MSQRPDTPTPGLGISGRLARAFQDNAMTPLLAMVAMLLGLFAVLVTPREEEPQINVTMANVLIPFPGASSTDVQNMVAGLPSRCCQQIADIEHTYSVSRPGVAVLTVQFKVGVPRTEALVRLYDVLNANQDWLPRNLGALPPIVKPKGIDDVPVLGVTLWSRDARTGAGAGTRGACLEAELKRVPGTREVQTIGGPGRAVMVLLDPAACASAAWMCRLQKIGPAANLGLPVGTVLKADGRPASAAVQAGEFLRNAPTTWANWWWACTGKPVYLREVARIEGRCAAGQRYVWFTARPAETPMGLPRPARVGLPAVTISRDQKARRKRRGRGPAAWPRGWTLRNTVMPADVEVTITRDYGETAAEKANKLIQKLAFATGRSSCWWALRWAAARR
jgi:multidrug efflux pump subunit AcrB